MSCLLSKIYINLFFPNARLAEYVYVINHVNKSTHADIHTYIQTANRYTSTFVHVGRRAAVSVDLSYDVNNNGSGTSWRFVPLH